MFDCPPAFAVPLDKLDPWGECIDKDSDGISLAKQSLAQVWQALGSMILHAGDLSEDRVAHQSIMSQVLDILAQMHHVDALPSTIYNYVPAKDPSVIQRPPTIHLLSSRIMTLLSDVAWKRHWKSEMAKAQEYGYELPSPRVQPQLSQVESGVWLDLVLWACVESDLVLEAAWIVSQMQRRSQDWAKRWSVISWEEVCRTKAPKLAWTAILKLQLDKARLNQSTGIGIANGGVSSVTMGERTISREVIEAIIDGTVNSTCNTEASSSYPFNQAVRMTQVCKDLLEANDAGLDARACNALVLRVIESGSCRRPPDMSALSQGNDPEDHSASILGLLYSVLYTDSKTGESQRLMSTLDNITNLIDGNKRTYIREFASELRERLLRGPKRLSQSSQPLLYPETPDYIVAQLLDSTTANKSKSLGERLFDNNDIDGGFLRSHVYKSPNLQPALLRYATENADHTIVTRVLEQLQPPLSEDMLHSLLRSQVLMNEWNATQEILDHLKSSEGTSWNASDATSLAAAVLRLSGLKQRKVVEGSKAEEILSGIFAGRYDNASDPSRPRDFQRIQLANQIKRMLRTIPGNCFHCLNYNKDRETGRLSAKAEVSPQAFGILLEAVVERFGSAAGMTLWKQWCRVPSSRRYVHSGQYLVVSGVVKPELRLLRMIMRPIIQKLPLFMDSSDQKSGTDETQATNENSASATIVLTPIERSVVRWTVSVYQKFGLNAEDIGREFPRVSKPDLGLASIV
ncbi:uncharacterized protein KY384_000553 [Bacidia gigantensis]|uniref:uncharacterized protein n=1 Tax=Bacidia gigantensis TaxID=2732470 RepID=UPI001D04C922|nr:uncharacterized protein KY384_000553 [Bacidia gigantensis]KAG8525793.1 hypothetical protein KY384_000553 [Bacidia gigantensis]